MSECVLFGSGFAMWYVVSYMLSHIVVYINVVDYVSYTRNVAKYTCFLDI